MYNFKNKKVLITGAAGGIGKATVKLFDKMGAEIIISGRKEIILQEVADSCGSYVHKVVCDLSDNNQINNLLAFITEKINGIDILVCNAGMTKDAMILRMKDEDWDRVLSVNLTSTFKLNRAAAKIMMNKRSGRIINISSIVGLMGNVGQVNYVTSKAGMIGMSKTFALEFAKRGITVNCIAPGFIITSMTDVLTEAQKSKIISTVPMDRAGLPEDVANAITFLASDQASYITGQVLRVDGGMLMS